MSNELVFITGANGFVGAVIVDEAIKAGYRVRGTVRRESAGKQVKDYFDSKYNAQSFEVAIVEDITKPESYAGKLDGVSYIIHVASPLAGTAGSNTSWRNGYIDPAVHGTVAVLEAALKAPSIKRVVFTSSMAALTPITGTPTGTVLREENAKGITVNPDTDFGSPFAAYHASKILADQASTRFLEERKPSFSVVSINPSFIFGQNLLQRSADQLSGTNGLLWQSLMSEKPLLEPQGVHVLDVAEAHVRALNAKVENGSKYLLTAPSYSWKEAARWVKKTYPQVPVKLEEMPEGQWLIDRSRAENELGFGESGWRTWQDFVGDVVQQQLELL